MTTPATGGATCVCGGLGRLNEFQLWFVFGARSTFASTATNPRQRTMSKPDSVLISARVQNRSDRKIPAKRYLAPVWTTATSTCSMGSQ